MSRIKYKVWNFFWEFKYSLRKLWNFIDDYKLYLLSIIFAVAGLVATFENVTWLMIAGAVLSYLVRGIQFGWDSALEQGSWDYYYHLPLWTKSTVTLLIVSVIGMMASHFLLEMTYLTGFLLSFNASLLLFYAFWILYLLVRFTRFKLYQHKELKEYRRRKREEEDDSEF